VIADLSSRALGALGKAATTAILSVQEQQSSAVIVVQPRRSFGPPATRTIRNFRSRRLEHDMRSKLLAGTAALLLTAGTVMASAGTASAAPRGWHGGFWPGAVAAGLAAGAVAAATSPLWAPGYYDYYPGYTYGYPAYADGPYYDYAPSAVAVAPAGGDATWCQAHFRSYNPSTGTYLGFDGQYHSCP
jgi:BA14K-like protein